MIGRNGQIVTDCLHPLSLATQPRDTALHTISRRSLLIKLSFPERRSRRML